MSLNQPAFLVLTIDGLGQGKIGANALRAPRKGRIAYQVTRGESDGRIWVEYRRQGTAADACPGWRFEIGDRELRLISQWSDLQRPTPLMFNFDPERGHVTLLGLMGEAGSVRLPAVLSFPNQGALRITGMPSRRHWATTPRAASRTRQTS